MSFLHVTLIIDAAAGLAMVGLFHLGRYRGARRWRPQHRAGR